MKQILNPSAKDAVSAAYSQAVQENFGVMLASVVGSQNYGTATPKSDVDMKVIIYPSFQAYWHNSYPTGHRQVEGTDHYYDIVTAHDWFHKGVLKGNMNFFEPLYSPYAITSGTKTNVLMRQMQELLEGNAIMIIQAQFWTAFRHLEDFMSDAARDNQEWERENLGYNAKSASNAYRLLKFTEKYFNTGVIDITHCAPSALDIRNGGKSKDELRKFLPEMFKAAGELYFNDFETKTKTTPSDALKAKDKTDTHEWQVQKAIIDMQLMRNNLELIRA